MQWKRHFRCIINRSYKLIQLLSEASYFIFSVKISLSNRKEVFLVLYMFLMKKVGENSFQTKCFQDNILTNQA